jgi:hypothetical protein
MADLVVSWTPEQEATGSLHVGAAPRRPLLAATVMTGSSPDLGART